MLETFLENNIQNKLQLFFTLLSYDSITTRDLSQTINLSFSSVRTLVDELNADLKGIVQIEKNNSAISLSLHDDSDFLKSIHSIYQNSAVLQCLKFLITNDSCRPFSYFIDNYFLTKSTAYRIREICREYLLAIGLDISRNKVIGEEYRIRFLIALLYYKYGFDCCDIDAESINLARTFILATNHVIDLDFLEQTSNEYGYFECLLILSWKRINHPLSFSESSEIHKLKELFIYQNIKDFSQKTLEPALNIKFCEADYEYLYLAYCSTNSCILADKWTQADIEHVHRIIFSHTNFSNLLQCFEQKFGTGIPGFPVLRSALVYFFKKCLLGLQCIIPNQDFYFDSWTDSLTQKVFHCVKDILHLWKDQNQIQYPIDDSHTFYLSLQIKSILHQAIPPVEVIVVSDLISEVESMKLFLYKNFSTQSITVSSILVNAQELEALYLKKNCVIVVNKKFERFLTSLGCSVQNTIVAITTEINPKDMESIGLAIFHYEKSAFLQLISLRTK